MSRLQADEKDFAILDRSLVLLVIIIAFLIIGVIAIIAAKDHDNLFERQKNQVELEGDIIKIRYSSRECHIILRNDEETCFIP